MRCPDCHGRAWPGHDSGIDESLSTSVGIRPHREASPALGPGRVGPGRVAAGAHITGRSRSPRCRPCRRARPPHAPPRLHTAETAPATDSMRCPLAIQCAMSLCARLRAGCGEPGSDIGYSETLRCISSPIGTRRRAVAVRGVDRDAAVGAHAAPASPRGCRRNPRPPRGRRPRRR